MSACRHVVVAVAFLACACSNEGGALGVDFRSDLEAVVEVSSVTIELDGADEERFIIRSGTMLRSGVRVARFDALDAGDHEVRLVLFREDGSRLGERRVRVRVSGETVVTLVYTRSCLSVVCPTGDPAATECNNGECVVPECSPENPAACGSSACANAGDCPASAVSCVQPSCDEGLCLADAVDAACAAEERCDLVDGCVPRPPTGDAGPDVGPADTGTADTGTADTGTADTGTADTGVPCDEGASCDRGNACEVGVIDCSTGEPVCALEFYVEAGGACPMCVVGCLVVGPMFPYECAGECNGNGCCAEPM